MIVKSYAKINSLLYVLGKRDDGYHEILTLMHKIRFFDVIEINKNLGGIKIRTDVDGLNNAENIVYKAAKLFFEKTRIKPQVDIEIEKHIPIGGGLGGGSSNAGYTLRALNELFDFPLDESDLFSLASELGSDVAFFVTDGSAIATGRGEKIRKIKCEYGNYRVMLAIPGIEISTAYVYKKLRLTNKKGLNKMASTVKGNCEISEVKRHLYNDLEAVVLEEFKILKWIKNTMIEYVGNGLLSGSGSCLFSIINAEVLQKDWLENLLGEKGIVCKTAEFAE